MDNTTIKALRVLEALAASEEPRGVAELGRQVGLTKSNTFRILVTLASQGYVRSHTETGRYSLTLRVWEQGAKVIERHPVRRVAQPHLRTLYGQLNETILLSVLEVPDVLYIAKMESDYPVRASARVGSRAPAWRTASGKAMLASHSDEVFEQVVALAQLPAEQAEQLREEFRQIRERGYSRSINGSRQGVNSVAAPVWSSDGAPTSAVSVSGPAERFSAERMAALGSAVMNAATRISEGLGVSSPAFGNLDFA
jgi:IclR family KDG regulon transcriptional repressor